MNSDWKLFIVIIAYTFATVFASERFSVTYDSDTKEWSIHEGVRNNWVAWAIYEKKTMETGWDVLDITTNYKQDDLVQAYGAGYIEGALTNEAIWNAWITYFNASLHMNIPQKIQTFMVNNDQYVRSMINSTHDSQQETDFWAQAALTVAQYDGLVAGYNAKAPTDKQITALEMLVYQANDDVPDISNAVGLTRPATGPQESMENGKCSVLVKPAPDGSELFTSHVTWAHFTTMLRIYKHYNFPFNLPTTKSSKVSFSSAPGTLISGDDFYITSSNLVVTETTNSVFNTSLYQYVTEQTVLYWIRNLVANRMASSGPEWVQWFSMHNSGTYNNQWIIVDNKLFTPNQPLLPNTLTVAEQIPGYIVSADQTDTLATAGYWASYNIPHYPFIYNISGYPAYYEKYGNFYSYSMCPRAQIFRRDQDTVNDLISMKHMMRYNKWQTDPLSEGNSCWSISCRGDLNPPDLNPGPFGGIDCKITSDKLSPKMESHAVAGPTWDSQPVFAWTNEWINYPSYGQAKVFAFDFVNMKPKHDN